MEGTEELSEKDLIKYTKQGKYILNVYLIHS